ncbi:hypothetical protein [Roseobacter sp.]|uniref:hypothetical protein n=1 Tax=Roseobacter sp. TaxID=1907202 RepID=UPI0032967C0C
MTTVITRLFKDEKTARDAAGRIAFLGVPDRAVSVVAHKNKATPDEVSARLSAAQVHPSAVEAYSQHIAKGCAAIIVRATYKPLTAATKVRAVLTKWDAVDAGDVVDDYFVPDGPEKASSILADHPLFLTVRPSRTDYEGGPVTAGMGFALLRPHKAKRSAIRGGGFKSRMFWPMPLLSTKTRKKSVMSGGRFMSKSFWPAALLSTKKRSNSVIRGGDLPLSRALGWPPVS